MRCILLETAVLAGRDADTGAARAAACALSVAVADVARVACSVLAWGWVGACFCFHQERLAFVEPRVGCTTNNTANITNTAELQGGVSSPPHPYRLDNTPTTASAE